MHHAPTQANRHCLMPLMPAAARHIASILRCAGTDLVPTARAAACYELSMAAYGYHDRLSARSAALTSAQLLFLAAELKRSGAGPAREPVFLPRGHDAAALKRDAYVLGSQAKGLTQEGVACALAHFRQAVEAQCVDLAASLLTELSGPRAQKKRALRETPARILPGFCSGPGTFDGAPLRPLSPLRRTAGRRWRHARAPIVRLRALYVQA